MKRSKEDQMALEDRCRGASERPWTIIKASEIDQKTYTYEEVQMVAESAYRRGFQQGWSFLHRFMDKEDPLMPEDLIKKLSKWEDKIITWRFGRKNCRPLPPENPGG
jgi:hypothetical protein